ncbi:hypothetical protein AMTR_s00075p00148970 [Amborella trichopoda]|uniref:Uncharacterized protein n=1 Tax=Amborella trichopoda TaxID=13333 RepID=W1P3Z4_AMBTC|nr:hypothetical protein AMTR_s00075p00148970 [Amborella trichopoda]
MCVWRYSFVFTLSISPGGVTPNGDAPHDEAPHYDASHSEAPQGDAPHGDAPHGATLAALPLTRTMILPLAHDDSLLP